MEKIFKQAQRHPYVTVVLYFMLYMAVFGLLEGWQRPVHIVHCRLDDFIPFCRWSVIPYVTWFGWVPAMLLYFYYRAPAFGRRLFCGLAAGTSLSLAIYAVFPTGLRLRRAVFGSDILSRLVRMIYRSDTATNVCPSLHVFVTVLLLLAVWSAPWPSSAAFRNIHSFIALSICVSTVLMRQHSLVDVACGVVLALWLFSAFCRPAMVQQPAHLHRQPQEERLF